jgi:hypothetical protein
VDQPLFDPRRLALIAARAARTNGDLFLHRRVVDDWCDRLAVEPVAANALMIGIPPGERPRLEPFATRIDWAEHLAAIDPAPGAYDRILLLGHLETVADPAVTARILHHLLAPGGRLVGACVGGASLARLGRALLEADRAAGHAAQRLHPMLDGASLASLLHAAGFAQPVIAVDRVAVSYPSLDRLVADLRAMGCGRALAAPSPPVTRAQYAKARTAFLDGEERAVERFDLLHFAARAPT